MSKSESDSCFTDIVSKTKYLQAFPYIYMAYTILPFNLLMQLMISVLILCFLFIYFNLSLHCQKACTVFIAVHTLSLPAVPWLLAVF